MIIKKMFKIIIFFILINLVTASNLSANNDFNVWMKQFKIKAIKSGISKQVVNQIMSEAKYLPKVIEYDRYQPELWDTYLYKKRSSNKKVKQGLTYKEIKLISKIEDEFEIEKELLLALMGIETNFGKYQMDIVSSLATLSLIKEVNFYEELLILN